MPVEIKELLIRAFVSENNENRESEDPKREVQIENSQDTISAVFNALRQEKER